MKNYFLNIPEEIYLLSIDENGQQNFSFKSEAFDYLIAASILMDLSIKHCIDADQRYIIPDKVTPTGDILLDQVIDEIVDFGNTRRIEDWIAYLSIHGQMYRDEIITSLIQKKVLKIENEKIFWFFLKRKYPLVDDTELEEVQTRIRNLVFSDELPEEQDIAIVSILSNANMLGSVFTDEEIANYQDRISQIAKMDFIGQMIASLLNDYKMPFFGSLLKKKSAEEMLEAHVHELKVKFRVTNNENLPAWVRKGTDQYELTLDYVREKGHAQITFNPRTKQYSELKYSYYLQGLTAGA
jgi:hypothetical protein